MAKVTYQELMGMAQSSNADERKGGFQIFQAWIKSGPQLQDSERLTQMEREILNQMFAQKGLGVKPTGPRVPLRR